MVVMENEFQEEGTHKLRISGTGLAGGYYIVMLESPLGIATDKILKQ